MPRKTFTVIASVVIILLILVSLFFFWINRYFIPQVLIPRTQMVIAKINQNNPVQLHIAKIEYQPWRGFVALGIEINAGKEKIICAEAIDVDLNFTQLLFKKIEISRINIIGASCSVNRKPKKDWNLVPVVNTLKKQNFDFSIPWLVIKEIKLEGATINFTDAHNKQNSLRRQFFPIDLTILNPAPLIFDITLKVNSNAKKKESLNLQLVFNASRESVVGKVQFKTACLTDYWNYYLDEYFKPWRLAVKNLSSEIAFAYQENTLTLEGSYVLNGADLRHGKIAVKSDLLAKEDSTVKLGKPFSSQTRIEANLDRLAIYLGKEKILANGKAIVAIDKQKINIKQLTGSSYTMPVDLKGSFVFLPQKKLHVDGKLWDLQHSLDLVLSSQNSANARWEGRVGQSSLLLTGAMPDIKNLLFNLEVKGRVHWKDLSKNFKISFNETTKHASLEVSLAKLKGSTEIAGKIKREINRPSNLQANLQLHFIDFAMFNFDPATFSLAATAQDGILGARIPQIQFCGGVLAGNTMLDSHSWGIELNAAALDLAWLGKYVKQLSGTKGKLSGNLALGGDWKDLDSIYGGGYYLVTNGELNNISFFQMIAQGVSDSTRGVMRPIFQRAEGNFRVKDGMLFLDKTRCQADHLLVRITGNCSFSGDTNVTVGAQVTRENLITTIRQVLFPPTVGFDLVANSILVKVTGKFPDLKQTTSVKPTEWFKNLFGTNDTITPQKYTIDKVWN